jgi:hypothetical protein
MARTGPLAQPDRFEADHRRTVVALESLRRHGHHGTRAGKSLGPLHAPVRFLVELVARYVVVSHVKSIAMNLRNLYWLREMQAVGGSRELELLRPARMDAQALVVITGGREIGIPTFVLGGLLIPAAISLWQLASGFAYAEWWIALLVCVGGVLIGLALSWLLLRGAALASRRIRLSTAEPLARLCTTVGHAGCARVRPLPDIRRRGHSVDARSVDRAAARRHDLACRPTNRQHASWPSTAPGAGEGNGAPDAIRASTDLRSFAILESRGRESAKTTIVDRPVCSSSRVPPSRTAAGTPRTVTRSRSGP